MRLQPQIVGDPAVGANVLTCWLMHVEWLFAFEGLGVWVAGCGGRRGPSRQRG